MSSSLRFSFLFLGLSSGTFYGCGHFSVSPPKKTSVDPVAELLHFQSRLRSLCFTGEGKGRFQSENHKYQFGYESLLNPQGGKWSLALSFPFHGEETIHMDWARALEGKIKMSGNFYGRVMEGAQEIPGEKQRIEKFSQELGVFFHFFSSQDRARCWVDVPQSLASEGIIGSCQLGPQMGPQKKLLWQNNQDNLILTLGTNTPYLLSLEASRWEDSYFHKMVVSLQDNKTSADETQENKLQLTLLLSQCVTP